jgi:phytoene/squalene synthetase
MGIGGLEEKEAGNAGNADMAVVAEVSLAVAAKAAAENFPVALRVLPRRYRAHLTALYGFARLVDDIGDEPLPGIPHDVTPETVTRIRLKLLDDLQQDVAKIYDTGAQEAQQAQQAQQAQEQDPELAAIRALKATVNACGIPRKPLDDLIQANRHDQLVTRYETYQELKGYCEQDLAKPAADGKVKQLIKFEADRAQQLLDEGAPLIGTLHGAARLAIAGYLAGGRAALKAIAGRDYDVLQSTPKPGKADTLKAMASCYIKGR